MKIHRTLYAPQLDYCLLVHANLIDPGKCTHFSKDSSVVIQWPFI